MSTIKLPELPPPDTDFEYSRDADGFSKYEDLWDANSMRAYAEQAVREALAAQVAQINAAMASMSMDGVNGGAVQKEYFKAGARRAIQAVNGALIPESSDG